jgi:hypothetical protein
MTVQSTWASKLLSTSNKDTLYPFSSSSSYRSCSISLYLSLSSILAFSLTFFVLAPSQKHIILHTNLSISLDSLNMSLREQSMQNMEVTLLVRNSGIGNPRNLRRRSRKKRRRRSRGNNVRTIAPKRRRLEWLKRETNSALEPLLPTTAAPAKFPFVHHTPLKIASSEGTMTTQVC